jgi:hydrogenase maturation factor
VVASRAGDYVAALAAEGIDAAVVGEVMAPADGRVLVTPDGPRPLVHPGLDPFWAAFGEWARAAG